MMKSINLLFILLLSICGTTHAQIIHTLAGNGTPADFGDGGPATASEINGPEGVAVDVAGNVYVSEYYGNRVRKITPAGIITTVAGNGTGGYLGDGVAATNTELNGPIGISVDASGNLYIADHNNNRLRKVDPSGMISTIAGTGFGGYGGDGFAATTATINGPYGVVADGGGNIYFSDQMDNRVRKIDATGIISTIAGTGLLGFSGDGMAATTAKMSTPEGIALDKSGNIYIADASNSRIRKVDGLGYISTIAGDASAGYSGDGVAATTTELNYAAGVAVDNTGIVYIADFENSRIRKVDLSGIITTAVGTGTSAYGGDGFAATAAQINWATGVAVGGGNMYIADFQNNRLRVVTCVNMPYVTAISGPGVVCSGATITLSDTVSGGVWSTGTSSVATIGTAGIVSGISSGTATITYILTNSCGADTAMIPVTVNTTPSAGTITGLDTVCIGHTLFLSDAVAGGTWGSLHIPVATVSGSGSVTGVASGKDTITYIVSNACGADTTKFAIFVRTPSSCPDAVGNVSAIQPPFMTVYPNPNHGLFSINISSASDEPAQVIVTNVVGQRIKELTMLANKATEMQLDAPAGIYFITAVCGAERQSVKVVVQ